MENAIDANLLVIISTPSVGSLAPLDKAISNTTLIPSTAWLRKLKSVMSLRDDMRISTCVLKLVLEIRLNKINKLNLLQNMALCSFEFEYCVVLNDSNFVTSRFTWEPSVSDEICQNSNCKNLLKNESPGISNRDLTCESTQRK